MNSKAGTDTKGLTGFAEYDEHRILFLFEKSIPTYLREGLMEYYTIVFGISISLFAWIICISKGVDTYIPPAALIFFLVFYRLSIRKIRALQIHRMALSLYREVSGEQ